MKDRYLEVTFRKGKPLAAYLYLPRPEGVESVRTERMDAGILVDFDKDDRPIGVEITDPAAVNPSDINAVVEGLGFDALDPEELARIPAA